MTEDGFNLGVGMWDITDFYCISRTWTTRQAQGGREELKVRKEGKFIFSRIKALRHQNATIPGRDAWLLSNCDSLEHNFTANQGA